MSKSDLTKKFVFVPKWVKSDVPQGHFGKNDQCAQLFPPQCVTPFIDTYVEALFEGFQKM